MAVNSFLLSLRDQVSQLQLKKKFVLKNYFNIFFRKLTNQAFSKSTFNAKLYLSIANSTKASTLYKAS